jgi:hypothetical protein
MTPEELEVYLSSRGAGVRAVQARTADVLNCCFFGLLLVS